MYVISIKDVNNILEKYELGNSGKAVAIEILQYYQVDEKICIVILIETILHVRYVMKLLSDKWICVEEEEKRFPIEEKNTKAEEILRPAVSVASIPTARGKKVKRIILFFEDGSFEDYEK